jgi:hypothetical protein
MEASEMAECCVQLLASFIFYLLIIMRFFSFVTVGLHGWHILKFMNLCAHTRTHQHTRNMTILLKLLLLIHKTSLGDTR